MITVFGRATSSNVQIVMWGIGELGVAHERLDYGHTFGGTNTPEFRAMNPNGLVPVIRDGELVMWESGAILRYLASRYGAAPFWPADPVARAPIDMWAEWGKVTLAAAFTTPIFWARVRTPARERDEAALANAITRFDGLLGILEPRLAPFVLGAELTLADVVIGSYLHRYYTIDIARPDRPAIRAYYDRLAERPAYREHVMVDWKVLEAEDA